MRTFLPPFADKRLEDGLFTEEGIERQLAVAHPLLLSEGKTATANYLATALPHGTRLATDRAYSGYCPHAFLKYPMMELERGGVRINLLKMAIRLKTTRVTL